MLNLLRTLKEFTQQENTISYQTDHTPFLCQNIKKMVNTNVKLWAQS